MKRFLRYSIRFFLFIFIFLLILPVLLYVPAIQNFAKDKAATILSEKTGWEIEINHFRLKFPLKVELSGVNGFTEKGDTLFHLESFKTGIAFTPLLHGKVVISELLVKDISTDMTGLIGGFNIQGKVGTLLLKSIDVSLSKQTGDVKNILLSDADVNMHIFPTPPDTIPKDTTTLNWIFRLGQLKVLNTGYSLKMEDSGMDLNCFIGNGNLRQGKLSLADNVYTVRTIRIAKSSYSMNLDTLPPLPGFDPAHMILNNINIEADSVYNQISTVKAVIKNASFRERSGFELTSLKGAYQMDSLFMAVSGLKLKTPYSFLSFDGRLDQSVFSKPRKGNVKGLLNGEVGKEDILFFVSSYAPDAAEIYPNHPLSLNLDVSGNMEQLDIKELKMELPTAFLLSATGFFNRLNDEKQTSADVQLTGDLRNLSFIPKLLPDTALQHQLTIPENIHLTGNLFADGGQYTGAIQCGFQESELTIKGSYYPVEEKYYVALAAEKLMLDKFLPKASFGMLTMHAKADGAGFDPFLPSSFVDLTADVSRFDIRKYRIENLNLEAGLHKSNYKIKLTGTDTILSMAVNLDGVLSKKEITAKLDADLKRIDLYNLKILESETVVGAQIQASGQTNLKDVYQLDATVNNMSLRDKGVLNKLGNLVLKANVNADSTLLSVKNGDLQLAFDAGAGLDTLLHSFSQFSTVLSGQLHDRKFEIDQLQSRLPEMVVQFAAGTQNALYGFVKSTGLSYKNVDLLMVNEKKDGIRINGVVNNLRKDTLLLNTVDLSILQRDKEIDYQITANSINKNPMKAFNAVASGTLEQDRLALNLFQKNGNNKVGLDLGLNLSMSDKEIVLRFDPYNPIILYRNWQVNPNNYILLNSQKHILADFLLTGENGMQLAVQSRDTLLAVGKNDLDVAIRKFDISKVSEVLPSVPSFAGIFNAEVNITFDQDQIDAKGNVTLDSVFYNKRSLGNLALDVNYESSKQVGQWAYASVNLDDKRILEGDLNLNSADSVQMAAHLFLYALPLKLADPFIPEAMASLTGSASGDLTMEKLAGQPLINGKVDLDSAAVLVSYANATYKFDEQPLVIKDNKLHFSNYEVKAYNNNPLVINGDFNFTDFNRMTADLRITGGNVELLNVKKQRGQMIYGRLVMNVNTTVKGPLNFLKIRGGINLLGGTNVNYVMLDSPVSAQNRVSNLVTFTSFNDTIDSNYKVNVQPVSLSGIDMLVTVNIAPSVQVGIDLSTNGDDRVELQGGGDLAFRLTPMGETDLSGRYALTGGFVRYNMPILPVAKTFNIQNGSYVEWSGQLMDPYINITASENIRTTVTEEGKGSRVVLFMPMIEIKNRLDDLSVTFTLQAPNDPTIQTQIAQMTPEERSRQAMNLIIMQSYTGPGTSAKASTSNALNAFIQKEINSFAGSALKGIDLSVGIDQYNTDGQAGSSRTDYSFRFSKKLFNDRFRIVVGGTVSSGQEVESSQQQSFIDDIVLEYMLDKTGTRYVKLFHQTGFESVLEGEIVETGIGVVLKRRVRKVRQLFIFNEKKRKQAIYAEPEEAKQPDSEATEKQGQQEMEGEKATPHNGKKTEE